MLRQMARLCRLLALLHDNKLGDSLDKSFASILEPENRKKSPALKEYTSADAAVFLSKAPKLSLNEYALIQEYFQSTGCPYQCYLDLPHPEFALILSPNAKHLTEFHDNGRTYSCNSSHISNSTIQFYDKSTQARLTGVIETILEIPLEGFLCKFILVHPHLELDNLDAMCTPYPQYPRMMTNAVKTVLSDNIVVIEPQHIITHLTTYKRPAGTYGIQQEILVICWAMNRGLR